MTSSFSLRPLRNRCERCVKFNTSLVPTGRERVPAVAGRNLDHDVISTERPILGANGEI
jgi:hypothetical protein